MQVAPIAFATLALALSGCGQSQGPEPPSHLLWISIDTLRADHLSCYGYERETSPNLDRLANSGVRFESCYSPTSWTLPSHLTMLTGQAISVHGLDEERHFGVRDENGNPQGVSLYGKFISEHLDEAGFLNGGFYSWKYLEPKYGFGAGFKRWQRIGRSISSHPKKLARLKRLRESGETQELAEWMESEPELFDFHAAGDDLVVDRGIEFLDAALEDDERVFLFLHLFDPHEDYVPNAPFDRLFTDPAYQGPIDGRNVSSKDSLVNRAMSAEDLAQLIALYDGEIAWTDSQIGRLLEELDRRGIAEQTLIQVTSDHGEEFFEHGGKSHRHNVYAETTRVPWILAGAADLPAGQVIHGPVGLVDQVPTVLAWLGLPVPEGLSGVDLSPVLRGETENAIREYTQVVFGFGADRAVTMHAGLRRGEEALLWSRSELTDPSYEYFKNTPKALDQRPPVATSTTDPRITALQAHLEQTQTRYRAQRKQAPLRKLTGGPPTAIDREELEACLLYTSPSPRDRTRSRMPSSA